MTFPLLRLPLLASIEVIKNTDVKYLISLIQLSKKARNLVKLSRVHIELTVSQSSIQFQKIADQGMDQWSVFFDLSEKPTDIPFKPPCDLKLERSNWYRIRAYKKKMGDFVEFFKVCSVSFELETCCSDNSLRYMEYAKDLGLKFSTARVLIGGSNGEVYRRLLKICSNASQLLVLFDTEEPFTFNRFNSVFDSEEDFTINGFNEYRRHKCRFSPKIRGVDWFTVDRMCALINYSEVSVGGLKWRSEDFNRFFKFWMASDGNLKSCELWACHAYVIPRVVMDGINHKEIHINEYELGPHTYEIQRADGVKAKVEFSSWTCTLKVIDA